MGVIDHRTFIRANTVVTATRLVPEIRLHLATEIAPIWEATEETLRQNQVPPPYWAFAWVGGQALARHVLDHPQLVRGRRVLDFAAGCGIAAIACAKSGAKRAIANEIDPFAAEALALNAALNEVALDVLVADLLDGGDPGVDVILAGDMCYEKPLAARVERWLRARAGEGITVLMGDPGRNYLPGSGLAEIARYLVPTTKELEDREERETVVWRVLP